MSRLQRDKENIAANGDYAAMRVSNPKVKVFVTTLEKPARRGQPRLKSGSTVYLIEYRRGRYFTFCYELKSSAETIASRLSGTQQEIDFNSTTNPDYCLHSVGVVE